MEIEIVEYTNLITEAIKLGISTGLLTSVTMFLLGFGTNQIIKMFKFISK